MEASLSDDFKYYSASRFYLLRFFDSNGKKREEIVGQNRYVRLTVPPGIWFGFKGLNNAKNMLLNVADIKHNDAEVERQDSDYFEFCWDIKK